MAICGCSNCMFVTAVVTLVLLPVQYLVPELAGAGSEGAESSRAPASSQAWLDASVALAQFPPLDLLATVMLIAIAVLTYLCEWIQRKIMERRIVKLNQYLMSSVERLRTWDAQQEQLETTLKLVQNATSEYNLLLFLLLRQHRAIHNNNCPPSNCFFDKDDVGFLSPAVDV